MKKSIRIGILLTLFCLVFAGGCNSKGEEELQDFYEMVESKDDKTENKDDKTESKDDNNQKPTDEPNKDTGSVLVTIHAPLIMKDFKDIQTEDLNTLLEKLSIYDISKERTGKIVVNRGEPLVAKITEAANELIANSPSIQESATIALSTTVQVEVSNMVFHENGTAMDKMWMNEIYQETFADMGVEDGVELDVTIIYKITNVAEQKTELYVPCTVEAYVLKTDVPDSTEVERTYMLTGSLREDFYMGCPKSEDCEIKWKTSVGSTKTESYAIAGGYMNDFYLEIKPIVSPENYFTGDYAEKDFSNPPGILSSYTVFTVEYTDARPDIMLTSPKGEIFSSSHENDLYYSRTESEGRIVMTIYHTYNEAWRVRVYKKGTDTVYVTMSYR